MLDIKLIREQSQFVEKALSRRNGKFSLSELNEIDERFRKVQAEWEGLNQRSNQISQSFKSGKLPAPETETLKEETKKIKIRREEIEKLRTNLEQELLTQQLQLPNIPLDSVPDGNDEKSNVEIHRWGTPRSPEGVRSHFDIGIELGVFDFERGVKLAESRFTLLLENGAKMERALMNFMLDLATKGYRETFPPILVNRNCFVGVGQLPKFEGDFYKCQDEDLYLISTAEVPLTNIYREEILAEQDLPILHAGYTPNFRREAGSAGKDTRGYIRQHQFNKVELVHFTTPETSLEHHERLTKNAEAILEALELPYRRIALCAGDLGFCSQKTFDLEVWFPSQNQYREISSCSVFGDFQARRANIRYKPKDGGKPRYVHTLNGSALAIGRTLASILENFQNSDGTVSIPNVLHPYLSGMTVLKPPKSA